MSGKSSALAVQLDTHLSHCLRRAPRRRRCWLRCCWRSQHHSLSSSTWARVSPCLARSARRPRARGRARGWACCGGCPGRGGGSCCGSPTCGRGRGRSRWSPSSARACPADTAAAASQWTSWLSWGRARTASDRILLFSRICLHNVGVGHLASSAGVLYQNGNKLFVTNQILLVFKYLQHKKTLVERVTKYEVCCVVVVPKADDCFQQYAAIKISNGITI